LKESSDLILAFARELYGREIRAELGCEPGDGYNYEASPDGALEVKAGSARGVLYAVYDALAGKRSGRAAPQFSIRGLNPCESLNRHTPKQIERLIDRMGRWRMNTLIIHSNYGFRTHRALIEREAAKRGIELVHYTYSNLCFMEGIGPEHFAKDERGQPMWEHAECETRLCASDPEGLEKYARNITGYIEAHPDYDPLIFCTADGTSTCCCSRCRDLDAWAQWYPTFNPFFEAAHGKRRLEALLYQQRWSVPGDLSRIGQLDRLLFDTHIRYPRTPLGVPHAWMKQGLRFCYPEDGDPVRDPRGDQPVNCYLWDRLGEWRDAFKGKLYVFENLMIQGIWGCPRPNTSVYLEDLRRFHRLGVDGVVYEAFEPGIGPFLPTFDAIAATMWDLGHPYVPSDFERAYLDADDEEFWGFLPGHPKWDGRRGHDPREALAKLLYRFQSLKPLAFQPVKALGSNAEAVACCREILDYVLDHPHREEFDWIYIAFYTLKKAAKLGAVTPGNETERDFLETVKLWDFQEAFGPTAREKAAETIFSLRQRLDAASPCAV